MRKIFAVLFFTLATSLNADSLPEPYASINVLPEDPFGWYANASQIENIFRNNEIHVVVEIGSWVGGGSTRHMANLIKAQGGGTLYAVDTWLGSGEHQPGQPFYQPVLDYVYQQFLSNMIHWELTDVVIPCRMKSVEAAKALNVKPDLVYLDGDHSAKAVYEDLKAWYPFVEERGILCGDDWEWKSIQITVIHFAKERNLKIYVSGSFWRLYH